MPGIKLVHCQILHSGCRGWGKPLAVSGIWSRVVESLTQPPLHLGDNEPAAPQGLVLVTGSPAAIIPALLGKPISLLSQGGW